MKRLFAVLMLLSSLAVTSWVFAQANGKTAFMGTAAYVPPPTPVPTPIPSPTSVFGGISITPVPQFRPRIRRHHKTVATPIPTPPNSGINTGAGSIMPNSALPK